MNGDVTVCYGQIYVAGDDGFTAGMSECFSDQRNGLCGAGHRGSLFLMVALHTGRVGFEAQLHDQAPPVDEQWEEVVEVSFHPENGSHLLCWGGYGAWPLDLDDTDYRVLYCARNMDRPRDGDPSDDEDRVIDHYLLQFWPAPPQPDRILTQTTHTAAQWHRWARGLPPSPTAEQKADAARRTKLKRERDLRAARREREQREWGGRLPDQPLRRIRSHALSLARLDRPLLDALAAVDPASQRQIARWVTRRGFTEARLVEVDWITPALTAMDRGEPLPAPLDDQQRAWDLLLSDSQVPHTTVTSPDGALDNCLQQAMTFPAIFATQHKDSLRAAVEALWAAAITFGYGRHPVLFTELRHTFPLLATHLE